ncbi:histidine phosphatase family protein [Treponema sp.]
MNTGTNIVDGSFFKELLKPTCFYLIRHGESAGNAAGIFQGHAEYPLNETGQGQARARGIELKKAINPDTRPLIFTSPLGRARESAQLIAEEAGLGAPVILNELIELDTGAWTGRTWKELRELSGTEWQDFHQRSWEAVEGAERQADLYDRAIQAWTRLRDAAIEHDSSTLIAVSHGGFLQWLVRATFGTKTWFPLVPAHNCGSYKLKIENTSGSSAYVAWETMDSH